MPPLRKPGFLVTMLSPRYGPLTAWASPEFTGSGRTDLFDAIGRDPEALLPGTVQGKDENRIVQHGFCASVRLCWGDPRQMLATSEWRHTKEPVNVFDLPCQSVVNVAEVDGDDGTPGAEPRPLWSPVLGAYLRCRRHL